VSSEKGTLTGVEVHPQVLHESIEGEVIVIDLATGTYYSLRDAAAEVWELVSHAPGVAAEDVADVLSRRYEDAPSDIAAEVARLVSMLEAEGLLRRVEVGVAPPLRVLGDAASVSEPRPFRSPRLEKYTDMQDLVLLDPVHEVGSSGWPHAQTGAERRSA
jgi:hypothetical protein